MVRGRALLGALALVLTTVGPATVVATNGEVAVASSTSETEALVEAATCARPLPVATAARSRAGETVVTFQVPATTRLRVEDGRVVAAATNTGCAPQDTDVFVTADRSATPAEVATALRDFRSGDWTTPGRWHLAR